MPEVLNNSLFQIVDAQRAAGVVILNRYWYLVNVTPGTLTAAELATVWQAAFNAVLPQVQSSIVDHETTTVEEVTSLTNFTSVPSTLTNGALVGAPIPTLIAAKIRLFRTSKETRSGWKRPYVGTESEMTGNSWTAAFVTSLQNYADECATPLSTTVGNATPVIVRQTVDPVTGEPNIASLWLYNIISSSQAQATVSSQVSRKPGVGI